MNVFLVYQPYYYLWHAYVYLEYYIYHDAHVDIHQNYFQNSEMCLFNPLFYKEIIHVDMYKRY